MPLANGIRVQVTDLHGRPFAAVGSGPSVTRRDNADAEQGPPDGATGLVTLGAGEDLAGTGADAATRLRLGWSTGGVMSADALQVPALGGGVTLNRQFLRAFAVDLDWHLRGNRTTSVVRGVPAEDGDIPDDLKPQVRDGVTVTYLTDGPDILGASNQVIARLAGATGSPLIFAVSPLLDDGVGVPPTPGAQAHWPVFPGPNPGGLFMPGNINPTAGATAAWTAGEDVVVTLAANLVPDGAAVRIYSQSFQLIEQIGEAPSFLRGDGGSAIASAGNPTQVLVLNPLNLAGGDPKPSPATLVFDLVITLRNGDRRLFANRRLDIGAGPAAAPADPFAAPDPMMPLGDEIKSICPAPLFGMERTTSPAGGLTNPIEIVRALGSESQPREGPRHPTMGRHEMIVISGIGDAGLNTGLAWDAVLSGARWSRETRSARLQAGNPGNPPGPDTHVHGVRVDGQLGYDLARHAVRRVQPMLPLPGGGGLTPSFGWIAFSGGDNMNEPDFMAPPTGASSGVLLQTVAAVAETPELSLLPPTTPLASDTPITLDDLIDDAAGALGIPSPADSIEVGNEDRLINEVRREYRLSTHGARDALWSLSRVLTEAEELVYIETAGFARTSRAPTSGGINGVGADAHQIDLVQLLANRMAAQPNLKVVICTPRESDLAAAPFAHRALLQRQEAFDLMSSVDSDRVVIFHPKGFPGRWTNLCSTSVIVDDVWSMTGATHFRRRGMTFDGSAALATLDRTMANGYSVGVRQQRINLMAAKLGITRLDGNGFPEPDFLRLARPAAAFDLIYDLLQQGGLGRIQPLWLGREDANLIAQTDDIADPDGTSGGGAGLTLASFLSEA